MLRAQLQSVFLTLNLALLVAGFTALTVEAVWTISGSNAQFEHQAQGMQKTVSQALALNRGNVKSLQPLLKELADSKIFSSVQIRAKSGLLLEVRHDQQMPAWLDRLPLANPAPVEKKLDGKKSLSIRLVPAADFAFYRLRITLPAILTVTAIIFLVVNATIWLSRKRLNFGRFAPPRWHKVLNGDQPQQTPTDLPTNQFKELLDKLPDMIVCCNSQGQLTYRNQASQIQLKLAENEKNDIALLDLIVPWDRIRFEELLTKTRSQGSSESFETKMAGTIRGVLPVTIYITPNPGINDETTLVIRDNSAASSELDRLQLRSQALDSMPLGIAVLSSRDNGELLYANPAFRTLLDLAESPGNGNSWLNRLHKNIPPLNVEQIRSAIDARLQASIDIAWQTEDAGTRILELLLSPTPNDESRQVCVVRDRSSETIHYEAIEQENTLRQKIIDDMPVGLCIVDHLAKIKAVNSAFAKLISADPKQLTGSAISSLLPATFAKHQLVYQGEISISAPQNPRTVRINTLSLKTADGHDEHVYFLEDITAFKQQMQMDSTELYRLQQTLDSITDAIITTNENGFIQYINPYAQKLTGLAEHQYKGLPFGQVVQLVDEKKREALVDPAIRAIRIGKTVKFRQDVLFIKGDRQELAVEISATPFSDRNNTVLGTVIVMKDVAKQRTLSQQMQHRASRDPLTGLINRRELLSLLESLQYEVEEQSRQHTLCYMDLDKFKVVNDSCGHQAGDELLRQVSHLMNDCMRASDVLARVGGDEFCAVFYNTSVENSRIVAEKIRDEVNRFRFAWENMFFDIGISIGLSGLQPYMTIEELVSAADQACYQAKERGRDCVYIASDSERSGERAISTPWNERLAQALDHDYFRLFCADAEAIQSAETSIPVYHEITLQLHEPSQSPLVASAFMPNAQRLNLTTTIERWSIGKLFATIAKRGEPSSTGHQREVFAIPVSTSTMAENDFLAFLTDKSRVHGVSAQQICLEIAEDDLVQNYSSAQHFMQLARQQGYTFCLSRFGSGVSSFAYLRNLPLEFIKIDSSLTQQLDTDPIDGIIVHAIKSIGEHMQIRIVCHHLEHPNLRDTVCQLGVDYIQASTKQAFALTTENIRPPKKTDTVQ